MPRGAARRPGASRTGRRGGDARGASGAVDHPPWCRHALDTYTFFGVATVNVGGCGRCRPCGQSSGAVGVVDQEQLDDINRLLAETKQADTQEGMAFL